MALEKTKLTVEIETKTSKSVKEIEVLTESIEELGDTTVKSSKKSMSAVEKTAEKYEKIAQQLNKVVIKNPMEDVAIAETVSREVEKTEEALMGFEKVAAVSAASFAAIGLAATNVVQGPFKRFIEATANLGNSMRKNVVFSVLAVAEVGTLLGPVIEALGNKLKESENSLVSFTGAVIAFAGAMASKFAAAVSLGLNILGSFLIRIGQSLIDSTKDAEKAFRKFETVINRFSFSIDAVGDAFGKAATGGLAQWKDVLEEVNDATVFSREEIAKSIKLLVLEGAQLGIGFEKNQKILQSATDIASATGDKLVDVVSKIISALNGEATALANLGFNVTKTGLSHSKFLKTGGLMLEQMNEREVLQLRVNELLKQASVITGAAANELNSLEGAERALNKTRNDTLVVLGKQAVVTKTMLRFQLQLFQAFNDLPEPVIEFIGTLKDLGGVLLTILGSIIKYTVISLSLVGVLKLVSKWVTKVTGVTISLRAVFFTLAKRIFFVVNAFIVVRKAIEELMESSPGFRALIEEIGKAFGFMGEEAKKSSEDVGVLSKFLSATFRVAVETVKLSLLGIAKIMTLVQIGVVSLKQAFSGSDKDILVYDNALKELQLRLADMSRESLNSQKALADVFGSGTAQAAESVDKFNNKLKETSSSINSFRSDVVKMAEDIQKDFDITSKRTQILGDAFENSVAKVKEARKKIDAVFKFKGTREQTAQKLAKAQQDLIIQEINAEKLRIDVVRKLIDLGKTAEIERLKASGNIVEAVERETKAREISFEKQVQGLMKIKVLTGGSLKGINRAREAILKLNAALLDKAALDESKKRIEEQAKLWEAQFNAAEVLLGLQLRLNAVYRQEEDSKTLQIEKLKLENSLNQLKLDNQKKQLLFAGALTKETEAQIDALKKALEIQSKTKQNELKPITINSIITGTGEIADNIVEGFKKGVDLFKNMDTSTFREFSNSLIVSFKTGANSALEAVKNADLGNIFQVLWKGLKEVSIFLATKVFSPEFINGLSDSVNRLVNLPQDLANAFINLSANLDKFVKNFASAFKDLLNKMPAILQSILDQIPAIIDTIADALVALLEKLPGMIAQIVDKLPEIISKLFDRLPEIIVALFEAIPQIVSKIIMALPDIIVQILDRLPEIIPPLVEGLIGSAGEIMVAFVDSLLVKGGLERIVKALIRAVPRIASALVRGIIMGLKRAFGAIFKGVKIPAPEVDTAKIGNALEKQINKVKKQATKASEEIFAVIDLDKVTKKRGDIKVDQVPDIPAQMEVAMEQMKSLWQAFLDGLKAIWMWIWENIITPLLEGLQKIWQWVYDNVLMPFLNFLRDVWLFVWDNVLNPIITLIRQVWLWVWDTVISPIIGVVKKAWQFVIDFFSTFVELIKKAWQFVLNFWEAFKDLLTKAWAVILEFWKGFSKLIKAAWDTVIDFFKGLPQLVKDAFNWVKTNILDKVYEVFTAPFMWVKTNILDKVASIFEPLTSGFKSVIKAIQDLMEPIRQLVEKVSNIKIPGSGGGGGGTMGQISTGAKKLGKKLGFATGGPIGPQSGIPFDQLKSQGDDRLIAAQAGEFVFNRATTQSIGSDTLNEINKTGMLPDTGNKTNINNKIIIEEGAIKFEAGDRSTEEMAEEFLEFIRRKSIDGEFTLSLDGLRTT